jgi:hypothetical protein
MQFVTQADKFDVNFATYSENHKGPPHMGKLIIV